MTLTSKPVAVCCDVNETLFAMDPIRSRMVDAGLQEGHFDTWFARVLRDGTSLAVTGAFTPFREVGLFHIQQLLAEENIARGQDGQEAAAKIIGGFNEVVAYPDVGPGFAGLVNAGVKVTTMTNGSVEITEGCVKRSGLAAHVSNMWDISQAGFFKPHPSVYKYVLEQLGLKPEQVLMVAVHPFDLHGAKTVGLQTAWINRTGATYPSFYKPPDVTATSFEDLLKYIPDAD